jgi:hypothetical protein
MQKHAGLALGFRRLEALVDPPDLFVATEDELPPGANRPSLKHIAVPLRKEGNEVPSCNPVFLVENRSFIPLGKETTVLECGVGPARFCQVTTRAVGVLGGVAQTAPSANIICPG